MLECTKEDVKTKRMYIRIDVCQQNKRKDLCSIVGGVVRGLSFKFPFPEKKVPGAKVKKGNKRESFI